MASAEPTVRTKRREPIDLSGAHIPGMSLSHADLAGSNFSRANLTEVNFQGSNLREADFRESNLTRANLTGADLTGANLASATLAFTALSGATLGEVDMTNANLSGALIEGVDLSKAKGLRWNLLLNARFDEATVMPDYLEEEPLFRLLEQAYPRRPWRDEFSGRIKDLLAELVKFERTANSSILDGLMQLRAFEEMEEQDEGKAG
ncbi:MAG: pentapeptide repeat-containing protein [Proteobacteria bacterium]|nr:pentapeptide repeat-containing protein [Pseudomonadota bacterium]